MLRGQIKRLVMDRGFGFIRTSDGQEYFFHRSGMTNGLRFESLQEGEAVEFEIEKSPKGPRAGSIGRAN